MENSPSPSPEAIGDPDDWKNASRWAINFSVPLLTDSMRIDNRERMRASCVRLPSWASVWFAGVLSDILYTLPGTDPWKHPRRDTNGVVTDEEFGTWTAATDLGVSAQLEDVSLSRDYAAIATPLSQPGRDVLAAAAAGFQACRDCLQPQGGETDGGRMFDIGSEALTWACFRRGQYLGGEDNFPFEVMVSWGQRAADFLSGREPSREAEQYVESEKINDALYLPWWEMPDLNPKD